MRWLGPSIVVVISVLAGCSAPRSLPFPDANWDLPVCRDQLTTRIGLDDMTPLGFRASDALNSVVGVHTGTMHWFSDQDFGATQSGVTFSPTDSYTPISVSVSAHLDDLVVIEHWNEAGLECWHDIEVPVDVSWSTADGGLAETRTLNLQITNLELVAFPMFDISPGTASAPRGTLTVTRTTPLVGSKPDSMTLSLTFTPESSGGSITYWRVVYEPTVGGYADSGLDIGAYSLTTLAPDAGGAD